MKTLISIVVPVYSSQSSIPRLIHELTEWSNTNLDYEFEFIFVNDGSVDNSSQVLRGLLCKGKITATLIDHMRNYGEHNAVLTAYRFCEGEFIVNIDDDLQNPPQEAIKLVAYAIANNFDVVYGDYREKKHALWRNLGSTVANYTAHSLLDSSDIRYLSSFRCVSHHVAELVSSYAGPYPYIDGLISQVTTNIGSLKVLHDKRHIGNSSYNITRLLRLWTIILTSFSVRPLRIAFAFGLIFFLSACLIAILLIFDQLINGTTAPGWSSIFILLLAGLGVQSFLIGLVGEYIGRILLTVSKKPQSSIRVIAEYPKKSNYQ